MKNILSLSLSLLFLAGCASASGAQRAPSQEAPKLGPLVVSAADTKDLCPDAAEGEACLVTWQEALQACEARGGHLPTARDYVAHVSALGTVVLEGAGVNGMPPPGFYLVDSVNPDGSRDAFYMNHQNYRRPADQVGNHLFWTASRPPLHPQYAHVYYDEWGGGGGKPEEHRLEVRNAFQCVE